MNIKVKIIIIVLSLLITALLISGIATSFSAQSGITQVAMSFMEFKATMMIKFIANQWNLLEQNGFSNDPEYIEVMKQSIIDYAKADLINRNRSETEEIYAFDNDGNVVMPADYTVELSDSEQQAVQQLIEARQTGWTEISLEGMDRVGNSFYAEQIGWHIFVSEQRDAFFTSVNEIISNSIIILSSTSIAAIILLFIFISYLIRPLKKVISAMEEIIANSDLSQRVEVEFKDETGHLAHTFNIMISNLERANKHIKDYAYRAVLAKKQEQKIKNIFKKYVPQDVIDQLSQNPSGALAGENRVLSILFSDIRSFTTISENYMPDELVLDLNRYFEMMVDIITKRGGVIDKYIGDAIMAFFGAPVKHENDVQNSVYASLEMLDAVEQFNQEQESKNNPPFHIGIGLNYGVVTVGNIGCETKMDYTVIGDMVNLASRLEGLTKEYKQGFVFSESVYRKIRGEVPCRYLDTVQAKGKTKGEQIFTARLKINEREEEAWGIYNAAVKHYRDSRDFKKAYALFAKALNILPNDPVCKIYMARCKEFIKHPPTKEWNGVYVMKSK